MQTAINVFLLLVTLHFIADFPLQGDWLAKAKNPTLRPIPDESIWAVSLLAHSWIQASMVYLVTGSYLIAFLELVLHSMIDQAKSEGLISYNVDQALHILCKVIWTIVFITIIKG